MGIKTPLPLPVHTLPQKLWQKDHFQTDQNYLSVHVWRDERVLNELNSSQIQRVVILETSSSIFDYFFLGQFTSKAMSKSERNMTLKTSWDNIIH